MHISLIAELNHLIHKDKTLNKKRSTYQKKNRNTIVSNPKLHKLPLQGELPLLCLSQLRAFKCCQKTSSDQSECNQLMSGSWWVKTQTVNLIVAISLIWDRHVELLISCCLFQFVQMLMFTFSLLFSPS